MFKKDTVRNLLMDYGGTVDTDGVHWATVLRQQYEALRIPVTDSSFKAAYVHGERTLATKPLIEPQHNFYDLLLIKAGIQIDYLIENSFLDEKARDAGYAEQIARRSCNFVRATIERAKDTLDYLYNKYPIILVSNFYGNIETVLDDFGIRQYFSRIIESAIVGVRKPDPAIWRLGAQALNTLPEHTAVIGDSYDKDIVSGKQAACQTIWLNVTGWEKAEDISQADAVINGFAELKSLL